MVRLLDKDRTPLFSLYGSPFDPVTGQWTDAPGHWGVTERGGVDIRPEGQVQAIPGTGTSVFVGSGALLAGEYRLKVGVVGVQDRTALYGLLREFKYAFLRARWVDDGGYHLPLARFTRVTDTQYPHPSRAEVEVTYQAATPFWYAPEESVLVTEGVTDLEVPGEAPVPLRVTLTASQDTVNPGIRTDAGETTWKGTLQAGQSLVIDGTPGVWRVTVGGVDQRLKLTGPQPRLNPGTTFVLVTGAGLSGSVAFRPGALMPVATVPDIGQTAVQLAAQEW